ncbi:MAG: hypothetical protein ACD_28C00129G0005 [uncultured bacterium]|nr:MAG: hypothetical protein ACD_28C00129G0005 [uncultured bacterium]KKT76149.1 MAG: putative endonuclease 4 [Candidatus Peregrinibacteria bacterium GW2011_GWA2_44_7]
MSNTSPLLGAHMSIANGFLAAAQETHELLGANALQLFLKSPRGRGITKLTVDDAHAFREYIKKVDIRFVVVHSSYLLNLAKPITGDPWALQSLIDDLRSTAQLGGAGVVLHIGKTLELAYGIAEDHLVQNLQTVLEATQDLSTEIILENTAGQGTEMGITFAQLASVYTKLGKPSRVSFCLDTCHLFAAGYDLTTAISVEQILKQFDEEIGTHKIRVFHFNDSKYPLGARRDRHQNLKEGHVGLEGLTVLAQFGARRGIPMILETPLRDGSHLEDFKILKIIAKN